MANVGWEFRKIVFIKKGCWVNDIPSFYLCDVEISTWLVHASSILTSYLCLTMTCN